MGSAKKRMRDGFYMNMWEEHQLEKEDVVQILKEANIDVSTFEVSKLKLYEETIKTHMSKQRIKKMMKPLIKHIPCPYPGCDGEKINYKRGSNLWYCTVGGDGHRIIWRAARIRALLAIKTGEFEEEDLNELITKSIKEYEKYVEEKDSGSTENPSD